MAKFFRRYLNRLLQSALRSEVERRVDALVDQRMNALLAARGCLADKPWKANILIPSMDIYRSPADSPFLVCSTCHAADFFHPRFAEISGLLALPPILHRKYWEWVFILAAARRYGIGRGKRALGFGVGAEPLGSALAHFGADVVGTDAPPELARARAKAVFAPKLAPFSPPACIVERQSGDARDEMPCKTPFDG